ncbi:MAG TPA: type II toxin-antitoxin system RelE/ParE family toxin [Candidatus Nanoarchaeia archaeon]|nr:type II toxin-antitoxin system RelE/ParE family toxin [Candidatus Nanoarchaeia archaeon]
MYTFEIKNKLARKLKKMAEKDPARYTEVSNKILLVAENPLIGKPLRNILKGKRRVHIGPFVLIYEIRENENKILFLEMQHHDEAYRY